MSVKPPHISIMLSFKGNFLSFCEFLLKPKASGPVLGLKGQGFGKLANKAVITEERKALILYYYA